MDIINVTNRSDGNVAYNLPELNTRRVYSIGETKRVPREEIVALFQKDGGAEIVKHYLLVDDKELVKEYWQDVPIEYFWTAQDVRKCLMEDSLDLFSETLDFAPRGVIDLIKTMAWQIPITDLNKIEAIKQKTGFDVLLAIEVMKTPEKPQTQTTGRKRLREEV